MSARFEIVRTWSGWHARIKAANNQTTWTTESFVRRESAAKAIDRIVTLFGGFIADDAAYTYVDDAGHISQRVHRAAIREVVQPGSAS